MSTTHFSGLEVSEGLTVAAGATLVDNTAFKTKRYVDTNNGSDTSDGLSWENAYLTMDAAFDNVDSGDIIYFRGNIREQLTTPLGAADVTIIGGICRPRHAEVAPWEATATP